MPSPEVRFQKNMAALVQITGEMSKTFKDYGITPPVSEGFINTIVAVLNSYDAEGLINDFIKYASPHWTKIFNKDQEFLRIYCDVVFGNSAMAKPFMPQFKEMILLAEQETFSVVVKGINGKTKEVLLSENDTKSLREFLDDMKEQTWDILHACVRISIKYIDSKRVPIITLLEDGTTSKKYTKKFAPGLKVGELATQWKVKFD